MPTVVSPEVPALYETLYSDLQGIIGTSDSQISSAWDGSPYAVNYATELLSADGNGGFAILQPAVKAAMLEELQAEYDMGVTAVTVQIGFPIFDKNLYVTLGETPVRRSRLSRRGSPTTRLWQTLSMAWA